MLAARAGNDDDRSYSSPFTIKGEAPTPGRVARRATILVKHRRMLLATIAIAHNIASNSHIQVLPFFGRAFRYLVSTRWRKVSDGIFRAMGWPGL